MKLIFLKTDQDFAHQKFRKGISSASLRLRFCENRQNLPRFGFIVPKKIMKLATDRNKIRRRLKNLLCKHLGAIKNFDILIFPLSSSLKRTYVQLEAELVGNFKRANLWKS